MPATYAAGSNSVEAQDDYDVDDQRNDTTPLLDAADEAEGLLAGDEPDDSDHGSLQDGVKQVEAITSAWTFRAMIITYILIFVVSFINSLQQQVTGNLSAYITSSFSRQPLLATASILSNIIGGVAKLPIAKVVDVWGRVEGFTLMVAFTTLGLLLMGACTNVQTYAAAQVFYWLGYDGMLYVVSIVVADTTSLRNRSIISGLTNTPFIVTTFAGPALAQRFYDGGDFRSAYAVFAALLPLLCAPLSLMFVYNHRQAVRKGLVVKRAPSERTWRESVAYHCVEFDVVGMLLCVAGFALLLLPLTLAASAPKQWHSPSIIAMLVTGVVCLVLFVVWERSFAQVCLVPWKYLKDRTIAGGCLVAGVLFCSFYCWDIYFSSYLQVVNHQSIQSAGYIVNIFTIGSSFVGPIVGLLIRWTGRFRWLGLCAVPLLALGTVLLIAFRHPGAAVGSIVACQVMNAVAGGMLVMTQAMAVMSAVGHGEVAVALAVQALFFSLGSAVGEAISGAIYTNTLPGNLLRYLPEEDRGDYREIYSSITKQLSYPWGSPARDAINRALGDTQHLLLVAGACFMPLALACVFMWRDIAVKDKKQVAGRVF